MFIMTMMINMATRMIVIARAPVFAIARVMGWFAYMVLGIQAARDIGRGIFFAR
jgi:citrate synthase